MKFFDRRVMVIVAAVAALLLPAMVPLPGAAPADAAPVPSPNASYGGDWLCHPGKPNDPCDIPNDRKDLRTGKTYPATTVPESDKAIDCFYIYPTITDNPGLQAPAAMTPPVESIARFQGAPFKNECRVYAPLYRQVTTFGLTPAAMIGLVGNHAMADLAYSDVKRAWYEFQRTRDKSRPYVVIGHSQGTMMARKLIREEIDPKPAVREKMAGGFLMGGNVLTAPGSDRGGDFRNIPICTQRGQYGCVVAYSTQVTDTPSLFGHSTLDALSLIMGLPFGPQYQVACTDPTKLTGTEGQPVGATLPSKPFAFGVIKVLMTIMSFPELEFPSSSATWTTGPGRYRLSCVDVAGFRRLNGAPIDDRQHVGEVPLFNTHLADMNLGVELLQQILREQGAAWQAAQ